MRWGDDAGVVGGERLRQFVLFALLQQEQVKSLLDFLLAFHRQQVFGLRGVGCYARCRLLLRLLQTFYLRIQRYDLIVDRPDYRTPHGCQSLIHIHNQRILRAAVGNQAVALQQLFVVFGNLRLYIGALYAGIGREQLRSVGIVG